MGGTTTPRLTLAERRAKKPSSLPTRILTVCLNLDLLAQVQRLTEEKRDVESEWRLKSPAEGAESSAPRKMGESKPKRLAEIDEELEACWEKMREDEGELLLRATPGGQWLRWKDEHPAREGSESDEHLAFGLCNASDLADDLGTYVAAWNGEDLSPDDWSSWLADQIAPADIGVMVQTVVEMHSTRISLPKSRSSLPPTEEPESA